MVRVRVTVRVRVRVRVSVVGIVVLLLNYKELLYIYMSELLKCRKYSSLCKASHFTVVCYRRRSKIAIFDSICL